MFEALLGRKPQAAEVAAISASPSPMEYVTNLPEYRNRFRDAVHSDDNARASLALWPPESRDLSVHIVLASGDDWQKTRATAERLAGQLVPGTFLTCCVASTATNHGIRLIAWNCMSTTV